MTNGKVLVAVQTILKNFPFYSSIVDNARFIEDPKIDTACCSPDLEIRYNPVFFDRLRDRELVFVILHEFLHFLNNHHARALAMNALTITTPYLMNIAMDLEINSFIVNKLEFKAFTEGVFPKNFGFKDDLVAEDYLGLLNKLLMRSPKNSSQGTPVKTLTGNGSNPDGSGSSQSEEDKDAKSQENTLSKYYGKNLTGNDLEAHSVDESEVKSNSDFHDEITLEVEDAMRNDSKSRGLAGTASQFRKVKLPEKRYDWKLLIKRLISHTESVKYTGYNRRTYSRISKRYGDSDILFPTYYEEKREVKLIVMLDISGSMYEESVEIMGYLKNLVKTIKRIDELELKIKLLFVDTCVINDKFYDIESVDKITAIPDGGGTDLTVGIQFVQDSKEKFDCMLILTDCGTPWIKIPGNIIVMTISDISSIPKEYRPPYKTFVIRGKHGKVV